MWGARRGGQGNARVRQLRHIGGRDLGVPQPPQRGGEGAASIALQGNQNKDYHSMIVSLYHYTIPPFWYFNEPIKLTDSRLLLACFLVWCLLVC